MDGPLVSRDYADSSPGRACSITRKKTHAPRMQSGSISWKKFAREVLKFTAMTHPVVGGHEDSEVYFRPGPECLQHRIHVILLPVPVVTFRLSLLRVLYFGSGGRVQ